MNQIGKSIAIVLCAGTLTVGGYLATNVLLGNKSTPTSETVKKDKEVVPETKSMSYAENVTDEQRKVITEDMQGVVAKTASSNGEAAAKFNVIGSRGMGYFVSQTSNGTVLLEQNVPEMPKDIDQAELPNMPKVELKEKTPQSPITSGVFVVYKSTEGRTGLSTYEDGPTARMYHDFPNGELTAYLLGPDSILYEAQIKTSDPARIYPWTLTLDGVITDEFKKGLAMFKPTEDKELQKAYSEILEKYL